MCNSCFSRNNGSTVKHIIWKHLIEIYKFHYPLTHYIIYILSKIITTQLKQLLPNVIIEEISFFLQKISKSMYTIKNHINLLNWVRYQTPFKKSFLLMLIYLNIEYIFKYMLVTYNYYHNKKTLKHKYLLTYIKLYYYTCRSDLSISNIMMNALLLVKFIYIWYIQYLHSNSFWIPYHDNSCYKLIFL